MQQLYINIFFIVWFLALSGLGVWLFRFFGKLSKGVDGNITRILDKVLDKEKENEKEIDSIKEDIKRIVRKDIKHVQKVGLVKFNPFKELGGEHSFSLALLNENDTGIVLTGLHTRERTRIYVKNIKKGKSGVELSENEKKALKKALKG
jgi:hypothetical protein